MKLIAHRGNTKGPCIERENTEEYIKEALAKGYYVEVDVWIWNKTFWLGHDSPQHATTIEFLKTPKLYIHAKNILAFAELLKYKEIVCFFHDVDKCTLTSNREIWTYPGHVLTPKSICVLPERYHKFTGSWSFLGDVVGVCSDFLED